MVAPVSPSRSWHEHIQSVSESSRARCTNRSTETPPRVAFCIAGAARGFSTRLVQMTLKHYLVDQLAPGHSGVVFLQLKVSDTNKLNGAGDYGIHFEQHRNSLSNLLATIGPGTWMESLLGEVSIVNGSGAFLGTGWRREPNTDPSSAVRDADADVWRRWRSSKCQHPWGALNSTNGASMPRRRAVTTEERLILAPLATAWCSAAIARHEASSGRAFDLVAFARPDLLLRGPVAPWCEWNWGHPATAAVCGASGSDGVWLVQRSLAHHLMHRAEVHAACGTTRALLAGLQTMRIDKRNPDGFGGGASAHSSCCGGAEALLSSALLQSPSLRIDRRSCAKLSWPDNTFLRQVQRTGPCPQSLDKVSCRHRQRHVCDTALHVRYVPGGLWSRIQSWHNSLTMQTAKVLRRLFKTNASACKQAMEEVAFST